MSLPKLLLVDDSDAILAYESAALAGHYAIATASNGEEALRKARDLHPAAILLDLSMPVMTGDEALVRLKADPGLRDIPVIVISSEEARARACLAKGAAAQLPKPVRSADLRVLVERVLADVRQRQSQASLAILPVVVGAFELGFPLDCVRAVVPIPTTSPLPGGPSYLREMIDFHGRPVCVLDLAVRLGTRHAVELIDRKLVLIESASELLAVMVDQIRDPEEVPAENFVARATIGGAEHGLLRETLAAIVRPGELGGAAAQNRPIVDPRALLSRRLLRGLPALLRSGTLRSDSPPAGPPEPFSG